MVLTLRNVSILSILSNLGHFRLLTLLTLPRLLMLLSEQPDYVAIALREAPSNRPRRRPCA